MQEVALYKRVSTDDQKNSCTIEAQTKDLNAYLDSNKQLHVYKCYEDNGISGTIPFAERPAGKQLIEDAKSGKFFEMVLVTRTDRLGRGMLVILRAVEIFTSLDIKFRATLEPYNTEDPAGKYMFNSMANFAEYEINSIRQRTVKGIDRIASNGIWPGGIVTYGYCKDKDRHLKVNDEKVILGKYSEADIIKRIYHMLADQKLTCKKVAQALNDEGIPTYSIKNSHLKRKKAKCWISAAIRQLVKYEIYKGTYTFGKKSKDPNRKIPFIVESIVDEDTWNKAQEVLKENNITSKRNSKREYLLTGKIRCSLCGKTFTGLEYRGYRYYICSNFKFKNNSDPTKCKNTLIRADAIENEIWKDGSYFIRKPELFKKFINSKLTGINFKAEIDKRNNMLNKLSAQRSKLVQAIRFGDNFLEKDIKVEIEMIKNETDKITEDLKYYKDLANNVEKQNQKAIEIEKSLTVFTDKIDNPPFHLKKEIMRMLLKEVIVHPKNLETNSRDVEISYHFSKDKIITKLSLTG